MYIPELGEAVCYGLPYKIFRYALQKIGIRGVPLNFFKTYLQNRVQLVKIRNSISESAVVEHDIRQGTVLGPVLVMIYLKMMPQFCTMKVTRIKLNKN